MGRSSISPEPDLAPTAFDLDWLRRRLSKALLSGTDTSALRGQISHAEEQRAAGEAAATQVNATLEKEQAETVAASASARAVASRNAIAARLARLQPPTLSSGR